MSFLSISEPGATPSPHQHKIAIGIDLGTTNSLIASVINGSPQIIKDAQDRELCPSVVYLGSDPALVGYPGLDKAIDDPQQTAISIKRLIGKNIEETLKAYPYLPYQYETSQNNLPLIKTTTGNYSAIEISSKILSHLNNLAGLRFQQPVLGAVITVPAYFDDNQRSATKKAAELAGINVLRLLNEPTAAAIAYGIDADQEGYVAIYDLGGGTFDISILHLSQGVFKVIATGGNTNLGGDDFDLLLAQDLCNKLELDFTSLNIQVKQQIIALSKEIKHQLSSQDLAQVSFAGQQISYNLADFEQLISPLINKSIMSCSRTLRDAKLTPQQIDKVICVGGSTRIRAVRNAIAQLFKQQPLTHLDPDLTVALGAAIQANILVGNRTSKDLLLLDVIPLSLGVETMGGVVDKIIHRNTAIPVIKAQEFTTYQNNQTSMTIHIVQGEREMAEDCRSLAKFTLRNLPLKVAGAVQVRITYQVDADGLLSVTAQEKQTGVNAQITVKPSFGLSDEEIIQMIVVAGDNAQQDFDKRRLVEQQVEATALKNSITEALDKDGDLLNAEQFQAIQQLVNKLEQTIAGTDPDAIKQAVRELDHATQDFANMRIDRIVSVALAGKNINKI